MDTRDIRRTLLRKLHAIEDRKKDHIFFYFDRDGKQHRATKLSHGLQGQLDDTLLGLIAKQLRLQKKELDSLVECSLKEDEYFKRWSERDQANRPTPQS
jgi:hypothetical protein